MARSKRAPFLVWMPLAFVAHVGLVQLLSALAAIRAERAHAADVTATATAAPIEVTVEDAPASALDRDEPPSPVVSTARARLAAATKARAEGRPPPGARGAEPSRPDSVAAQNPQEMATGADADGEPIAVPRGPLSLGLGLNGGGRANSGGIDLNVRSGDIESIVGKGEIERIARADSERRVAEHRGRFAGMDPSAYKGALESYVPAVKIGNQQSLGVAQIPFAKYLKQIAARLQPVFVDGFVSWLRTLPSDHPMRRPHQFTRVELVIDARTGALVRQGVVLTSGVTGFDLAALHAIKRAGPFGAAPDGIASADGRVYVQWDLYNDEYSACTVGNARPSIVKTDGAPAAAGP